MSIGSDFFKIAVAEVFIFLDDVQFSKNGYINRDRIGGESRSRWLTAPVSYRFGGPINRVQPAGVDWVDRHLNVLSDYYGRARHFHNVRSRITDIYCFAPKKDLAAVNRHLIETIAAELGLWTRFADSSNFSIGKNAVMTGLLH